MNPGAGTGAAPQGAESDAEVVARLLGRDPGGAFTVAVRGADGRPMVITNEPFLRDGTPMPTRYWLVDPELRVLVGRLEAAGGVREADLEVDGTALAETPSPLCRRTRRARFPMAGPDLVRVEEWAVPARESSVCTPTWPGGWLAGTTWSGSGWRAACA